MLRFEIENLSATVVHDEFQCGSVDEAVRIFYKLCVDRLRDCNDRFCLYLYSEAGDELCVIASYDDFINRVDSLIRISGGI